MRTKIATILLSGLALAGCGDGGATADAERQQFERAMDGMLRDMDEPERTEFCAASAEEGRATTLTALRTGWESSTDATFHDDVAAEVVWEWCDEIESETHEDW